MTENTTVSPIIAKIKVVFLLECVFMGELKFVVFSTVALEEPVMNA